MQYNIMLLVCDFANVFVWAIVPVRFSMDFIYQLLSIVLFYSLICLWQRRTTGLYTKTLAKIIYRDLTRFLVVFAVVFIAFCGALFLSLKATDSLELFRYALSCTLHNVLRRISLKANGRTLFAILGFYVLPRDVKDKGWSGHLGAVNKRNPQHFFVPVHQHGHYDVR